MKTLAKVLLIGLLMITAGSARAQYPPCPPCPTDAPPTNVAWTSQSYQTQITVNGQICDVQICYCTRQTSPGNNDFTITAIMFADPNCHQGATTQQIVDAAYQQIFADNPMNFPCPPCPNSTNWWREVRATCWSHYIDQQTGTEIYEPCETRGWCMTPFNICCNVTGAPTVIQGETVVFSEECGEGCDDVTCPN